jgi:hypothetical protein
VSVVGAACVYRTNVGQVAVLVLVGSLIGRVSAVCLSDHLPAPVDGTQVRTIELPLFVSPRTAAV